MCIRDSTTTVGPAHAPLPTLDASAVSYAKVDGARAWGEALSLIHISEPTRPY